MKKFLLLFALLLFPAAAHAVEADNYCLNTGTQPPQFVPCSSGNPLAVTGSFTPAGTQNTNWIQTLGSAITVGTGASTANTPRVTTSTDSTIGLVAGSAIIGNVRIDQTTPGTTNGVQVNAALPAGSNLIGAVDTAGSINVTPTVQNASYVSGNDIGGLVSFTMPRTASGLLQSVALQFIGGATTTINAFCFDSNPTGSTFTDKSTFTIAAADEAKRINKTALALAPAAATGDTVTGAEQNQYAMPFNSTATIWCAYASTGTFTPASTTDMRATIRFVQGAQ